MQIIISEAKQTFLNKNNSEINEQKILSYIQNHRFYREQLLQHFSSTKLRQLKKQIKDAKSSNTQIYNRLEQLSLYLNKQNNRIMFQIYELILKNPSGLTYKDIEKKIHHKIQIVNISHYCCRLNKMNFVDLKHQKSEKVVYPKKFIDKHKNSSIKNNKQNVRKKIDDQDDQVNDKIIQNGEQSNLFLFQQLSMLDNIWVNVSGADSLHNKGITNQQIKYKINKSAQSKLIMKVMENAKETFNFRRDMVSQGKIFQHRYSNTTNELKRTLESQKQVYVNQHNTINQKQVLAKHIQQFLMKKFPQRPKESFLIQLINEKFKNYQTALGTKKAIRRQCTPIKLARYIIILNRIDQKYPQTHSQLKKMIIDEQKDIQNGTMHKRSIIGILEGLVSQQILIQQNEYYFPGWDPHGQKVDPIKQINEDVQLERVPRKRVKLNSLEQNKYINQNKDILFGEKTTLQQYKRQLKIMLMMATLEAILKAKLKKSFKFIFYAKRVKVAIKYYEPQINILQIMQEQSIKIPDISAVSYEQYTSQIDEYVNLYGKKQKVDINTTNYEIIKMFRKYPERSIEVMKQKFGNNWRQKIQAMVQNHYLQEVCGKIKIVTHLRNFI